MPNAAPAEPPSLPAPFSVVIPFHNEAGNAAPLLHEIHNLHPTAEILAIDDGSTDATLAEISTVPGVTLLRHSSNLGQSAALWTGLQAASSDLIVLMDGDGQNDPADIARLIPLAAPGTLVCGVRTQRADSLWRGLCGTSANFFRNLLLRDGLSDSGCTLKVLHRDDLHRFIFFNGFHRFLGAIARAGGIRLLQIPVSHRPRQHGRSHYSARGRFLRGLADLLGVLWLLSRRKSLPLPPPLPHN